MKIILLVIANTFMPFEIYAAPPAGSVYIDGKQNMAGLILCHGRGKHPKWKVVNPLRKSAHKKLGYHTLSLQMPAEEKNWKKYAEDFSKAFSTIQAGITFLKEEKGVKTVYLMGHSMGARMASAFVAANPQSPVAGLIVAGCRNNGGKPLSCKRYLKKVSIPVLDIWGDGSENDHVHASQRSEFVSEIYQQQPVAEANHRYEGYEDKFVIETLDWLQKQNSAD